MAVTPVTPVGGINYVIVTGGTAVEVAPAGINGGYISNPLYAADQGIGTAETLIVDPVNIADSASSSGFNTATRLLPGQTFTLIPGSTVAVTANSATSGHKFTAVFW